MICKTHFSDSQPRVKLDSSKTSWHVGSQDQDYLVAELQLRQLSPGFEPLVEIWVQKSQLVVLRHVS